MDPEKRKEYNKKYYEKNKLNIAQKLYTKVTCELCGKTVSHQNMPKHIKSNYCTSRVKKGVEKDLEDLKKEIAELKQMY